MVFLPLFLFCFFLLDKANSCLGCEDFLISPMIASTSTCCCRMRNEQPMAETVNTGEAMLNTVWAIKRKGLFLQRNWMITEIQTEKCENLWLKNVDEENIRLRALLSRPPPKPANASALQTELHSDLHTRVSKSLLKSIFQLNLSTLIHFAVCSVPNENLLKMYLVLYKLGKYSSLHLHGNNLSNSSFPFPQVKNREPYFFYLQAFLLLYQL